MASRAKKLPRQFVDICVIYASERDKGKWVAHSLETDQIGVGDCVLDAYVELRKALTALLQAAEEDHSIEIYTPAPDSVRRRLKRARKLPDEIIEIAEMRLTGQFPVNMDRPWTPPVKNLSASITEMVG